MESLRNMLVAHESLTAGRTGSRRVRTWIRSALKKLCACAAATCTLSIAAAAESPPLQEGLWEIRGQSVANPGHKVTDFAYRLCRTHAYDKAMDDLVKNAKECTTSFEDLGGGRYASASRCTSGGTVIESKGTYTYESSTATHLESFATYDPPYRGKTDEKLVQDQRFLGACPAGMKPGDRIMDHGALQRYGQ